MVTIDLDQSEAEANLANELTAEIDLSDPAQVSTVAYDVDQDLVPILLTFISAEKFSDIFFKSQNYVHMVRISSQTQPTKIILSLWADLHRRSLKFFLFFCRPTFPDSSNPYEGLLSRTDVAFGHSNMYIDKIQCGPF
jgi:hypothetical protein